MLAVFLVGCEGGPPESVRAAPEVTDGVEAPQGVFYQSPFVYCGQVVNADEPGAPYVGPRYPDDVFRVLADEMGLPEDAPERSATPEFHWRCMDGFVYACTYGPNLPCGQADLNSRPSAEMIDYCESQFDGAPLPGSLVGHQTIYGWVCRGETPATTYQKYEVDHQGFITSFWRWIPEPAPETSTASTPSAATPPATGAPSQ